MANISSEIAAIQEAARGSEVRQPMVSALNKINADVLPDTSSADSGKILRVNSNGEWEKGSLDGYMPIPTASKNINENGTYDVTDYAEAVVSVPTSAGTLISKTITENGTYDPIDDNADGYNEVVVNVSGGGGGDLPSGVYYGSSEPDNTVGSNGDLYYQEFTSPDELVSDGDCYIDTGYYPNARSRIECCIKLHTLAERYDTIFGCRNGNAGRFTMRYANSSNGAIQAQKSLTPSANYSGYNVYYDSKTALGLDVRKNQPLDSYIVLGIGRSVQSPTDRSKSFSFFDSAREYSVGNPSNTDAFPYKVFLFANNNAGSAGDWAFISMRWCKIWDENNVLVRDFVPYLDNGEACMFDNVNQTIYRNQGIGSFTFNAGKQHSLKAVWEKQSGAWVRKYVPDGIVFYNPNV